jgi:hypothetical protein
MVAAADGGLAGQSSIRRENTFKASGFGSYYTVAKPAVGVRVAPGGPRRARQF